jgi:hypothetical protein
MLRLDTAKQRGLIAPCHAKSRLPNQTVRKRRPLQRWDSLAHLRWPEAHRLPQRRIAASRRRKSPRSYLPRKKSLTSAWQLFTSSTKTPPDRPASSSPRKADVAMAVVTVDTGVDTAAELTVVAAADMAAAEAAVSVDAAADAVAAVAVAAYGWGRSAFADGRRKLCQHERTHVACSSCHRSDSCLS